jgi:hypothetical protein
MATKFKVSPVTGLNGRRGPGPDAEVVRVAKPGDIITAEKVVDGYAVTKSGVHYLLGFLQEVKS